MTDHAPAGETDAARLDATEQRAAVRERYGRIASESSCCGATGSSDASPADRSAKLGYPADDLDGVASGANLGLGCGNPTALAGLERGDTVLDLGSGAGFDCFLAAREVGSTGRVIGVDTTPAMVEKARENVDRNGATNVEFRLGQIEHLPVADEAVDVVISNCVINLSPATSRVFHEAYRVLRPGGHLAVSDVVLTAEPPAELRTDPESIASCVGGASSIPSLEAMLTDAGFEDVALEPKADSERFIREWDDDRDASDYLVAATIEGRKPERSHP